MSVTMNKPQTEQDAAGVQQTTCCVVGAGPAGAVLALLLARAGVAVTLLELHKDFDRDFRGDTLHPSVMEIMDQLGLAERLLALPHSKLRSLNFMGDTGAGLQVDFGSLKTKFPYITMLPQVRFLEVVTAEAARYPHFQLHMDANVQELIEEGGAVRGVRYRDGAGRTHELRALLTVGADGRSSRVRRLSGMEPVKSAPPMDVLWFRLPRLAADGAGVSGRFLRGHIIILLDRDTEWQIGYVIPKGSYQQLRAKGLDELRQNVAAAVPALADRVEHLKDWKQVAMLSVESSCLTRWYKPGLLLIGDAAHVMSPVAGVGINYAIQDAVVAANVLAGPLKAGAVSVRELRTVQRRRRWPVRVIQKFQALIQQRLVAPALDAAAQPVGPPAFLRWPLLRRLVARVVAFGVRRVRVES
ncbi:MAG TPA: FAD-dependent oxidoreductase [Pyrinomonadaceae bacterium]|jgi:2-polyprenyl-6-methoxyphenol hydroxylase-like FAD-dependent oxidoreductase